MTECRMCALSLFLIVFLAAFFAQFSAALGSDEIWQVQTKLLENGFDPGKIDGVMGRRTEAALVRFQQDRQLPVTGRPDAKTLESLGISEKAQAGERADKADTKVQCNSYATYSADGRGRISGIEIVCECGGQQVAMNFCMQ